MNVVDSPAWLSYFAGNDNAAVFSYPIEDSGRLIVPSITVTEVFTLVWTQDTDFESLEDVKYFPKKEIHISTSVPQYN